MKYPLRSSLAKQDEGYLAKYERERARKILRSYELTDTQLAAYDARLAGIARRLDAVDARKSK